MLIDAEKSCFLLVDVQEKLTPLVNEPEVLTDNCLWLLKLAREMDIPLLVTEQYPRGLGHTLEPLKALMIEEDAIDKVHFSCAADSSCLSRIDSLHREQVIIAGIETHVCILQTALELHDTGKQVFVVEDAVSARHEADHRRGLARMQAHGIQLVTKEMVFFEWLRQAGTPRFKVLSKAFMR